MKKHKVILSRLNLDSAYYTDLYRKKGFQITDPPSITFDDEKHKALHGPQSEIYGTTYGDDKEFAERYRCKCGHLISRQYEGETCPVCGTVVAYEGTDIEKTGWLSLGINESTGKMNRIVAPFYYNKLVLTLGKKVFPDIINSSYRIDTDGHKVKIDGAVDRVLSSPYDGIGIDGFYDNFEEIITYFMAKFKNKPSKLAACKNLLNEKAKVFTSHIPVYSTMLRPQSITSDSFYFQSIDRIINTLCTLTFRITSCTDLERDNLLLRIQEKFLNMWDDTFELLNGKHGYIRDQILGGSLNYTARNVIVPGTDLRDDEVKFSYHTMRVLFKHKLIKYISKIDGISIAKAEETWDRSDTFDDHVYNIMVHMIENDELYVLINRNPTINYESIILMRVVEILDDKTSYVMCIPEGILEGLNADQQPSRSVHSSNIMESSL